MSVQNYGATFRTQSVENQLVADIAIAPVLDGDPQTVTALIQTAAAAEIPLVLGEGTWMVSARASQNLNNGAATYQYVQCLLENSVVVGPPVAACAAITGSDILNGANQEIYHHCSGFVTIFPGTTLSLVFRCYVTGSTQIIDFTTGYAQIVATKISA